MYQYTCSIQSFEILASFCSWAGCLNLTWLKIPEDTFLRDVAHLICQELFVYLTFVVDLCTRQMTIHDIDSFIHWQNTHLKQLTCYVFVFQTVKFKQYLLSMGIPDPVTRESHGTGDKYYTELARQLATVLESPIKVMYRKNVLRCSLIRVCLVCHSIISWTHLLHMVKSLCSQSTIMNYFGCLKFLDFYDICDHLWLFSRGEKMFNQTNNTLKVQSSSHWNQSDMHVCKEFVNYPE